MLWTTSDVWCDVCGQNAHGDVGRRTRAEARAGAKRRRFKRVRAADGRMLDVCEPCRKHDAATVTAVLEGRAPTVTGA